MAIELKRVAPMAAFVPLCREVSLGLHNGVAPTAEYAQRVENQLLFTAAAESGFVERRQRGFKWDSTLGNAGGWGIWQTEWGSVYDGLDQLRRRPVLAANAARIINRGEGTDLEWLLSLSMTRLLRVIFGNDRVACVFARLHYSRVPLPIPAGALAQAEYWKKHYNTVKGSGDVLMAMRQWEFHRRALEEVGERWKDEG